MLRMAENDVGFELIALADGLIAKSKVIIHPVRGKHLAAAAAGRMTINRIFFHIRHYYLSKQRRCASPNERPRTQLSNPLLKSGRKSAFFLHPVIIRVVPRSSRRSRFSSLCCRTLFVSAVIVIDRRRKRPPKTVFVGKFAFTVEEELFDFDALVNWAAAAAFPSFIGRTNKKSIPKCTSDYNSPPLEQRFHIPSPMQDRRR